VREEIVHRAKSGGLRALRPEHSLAVEPLGPMQHILLFSDAARTAVGSHLLDPRLRQFLKEQRDLGEHGLDGLSRGEPPVRAADGVGLTCHRTSGRSMV
jgi:hypothetical protein